jgi:hypothetical protein
VVERLATSQEGLGSVELVSSFNADTNLREIKAKLQKSPQTISVPFLKCTVYRNAFKMKISDINIASILRLVSYLCAGSLTSLFSRKLRVVSFSFVRSVVILNRYGA